MKKRALLIASAGGFVLFVAYLVFNGFVWRSQVGAFPISGFVSPAERKSEFAPISIWGEAPPGERDYWRVKKAIKLLILKKEAFVGDELIPTEKIREYLDARVLSGEIEYVVVFAAKESRWADIFPVLDECRRSRVSIVLLNYREV